MDDESADGMVTHEGGNIRLRCVATGSPKPIVTWKREDGRNIILREDGQKQCKCKALSKAISYLQDSRVILHWFRESNLKDFLKFQY